MPIIRTCECSVCGVIVEAWLNSGNDPNPPCPQGCVPETEWKPGQVNIIGHKAKAIDITQKIIEEDFGVTNFSDRQREGDQAYITPPETREERDTQEFVNDQVRKALNTPGVEAAMKENNPTAAAALKNPNLAPQMKGFWGPAGAAPLAVQSAMAGAKSGPAADNNAMSILHRGLESGEIGDPVKKMRPIGKA